MGKSYLLGPFHLDAEAETLFRDGVPVALSHRAVALLRALVERPGLAVFKDGLMDAAWPGLAIEESNLTVQMAALRRVLAEEPGGGQWIETLTRRGYRFVGPISVAGEGSVKDAAAGTAPALAVPEQPSIAVLPFQNTSGDADQEYFADGMVEEILTVLSRFRSLFVIARNSSFTYKGRPVDVRQVGRELGVRYVLEGSVRRSSKRIRITAQLVSASTGAHLWADRFDGTQEDIFDLQDRVAGSVAGEIEPRLNRRPGRSATRRCAWPTRRSTSIADLP
jgi:TolB-like protein